MVFPSQLTDYLQSSVDKFTFTIAEDLDASETGVDINGGTAAFEVPCMINIGGELMKVLSKTSTTLTVGTRGTYGTAASIHTTGDAGYIPFTAQHYDELVDQKDAVVKYLCRTEASLPGSGIEYEMIEYADKVYVYNGAGWELIGNITDHDDLKDLGEGDPHTDYYLTADMVAAHDALSGAHVTGGDNHDHLDGQGFGRLQTTSGAPVTTPNDGEIALDTSTGILYTGYSSSWSAVEGAPSGLIMPFDPANLSGSCPTGWSRYTDLDSKFVKGTSGITSTTGGSATHSHTFDSTDVVSHSHSIDAQSITETASKSHQHYWDIRAGGSEKAINNFGGSVSGSVSSTAAGGHGHTGTISNNSESTGSASPSTDSGNGEPPYQKVVWCQKD